MENPQRIFNEKLVENLTPNGHPSKLSPELYAIASKKEIREFLELEEDEYGQVIEGIAEGRNFLAELRRIEQESSIPELRVLASEMLKNETLSAQSQVIVGRMKHGSCGTHTSHLFNIEDSAGNIRLLMSGNSFVSEVYEDDIIPFTQENMNETVLHEQIHHFTVMILKLYEKYGEESRKDLEEWLPQYAIEFAEDTFNLHHSYKENGGWAPVHEFITWGLTSTHGQQEIARLREMVVGETNMYDELFRVFAKFYQRADPEMFSDLLDENGDPTAQMILVAQSQVSGNTI
jgi:hypothetical protein